MRAVVEVEDERRAVRRRPRLRRAAVLVMQCTVVIVCVALTTFAAVLAQERQIRAATEERVLDVARSLAELDQVQQAIGADGATGELQPLADLISEASGVDYVVITDEQGIRITHPNPAERGRLVSTDATTVLGGQTFVGTEVGTLGPTLRAKVPVYRDGTIVGTASVGILESEIAADLESSVWQLAPWVLISVVVGCVAAALLTQLVNRRVRRLESEVAELRVQRRIADALRDQAHEFRTRMHVIYGLVEGSKPDDAMDYISSFVPVASAAGIDAEIEDDRLRALLAASASELAAHGGRLEVDPVSMVEAGVLSDDDLTVMSNLLRNAVEATESEGLVTMHVQADRGGVVVTVTDDGAGVPAGVRTKLFEHGFSTKDADDGVGERGVGLALTLAIVRSRGGHIDVGSADGGGASFAVQMPAAPARAGRSR